MSKTAIALAACLCAGPASAQPVAPYDRMPPIAADKLSAAQRQASDDFLQQRKVPVFGPFVPLLRSPELMTAARSMGDYLRYKSTLDPRISELVILVTAREWTQDLEWQVHYPIAIKAGLKPEIAKAVSEGRMPPGMAEDEAIAWEFSTELHRNKSVSDTTYARALARFGEQGVMDIAGINGYYTLLGMAMNAARTTPPGGQPPLDPFPSGFVRN
jgi:4-carboxymuconolactone decarboxylase